MREWVYIPAGRRCALETARAVQRIIFGVWLCWLHKIRLLKVLDLASDGGVAGCISTALQS
jgi:hypothetical protein